VTLVNIHNTVYLIVSPMPNFHANLECASCINCNLSSLVEMQNFSYQYNMLFFWWYPWFHLPCSIVMYTILKVPSSWKGYNSRINPNPLILWGPDSMPENLFIIIFYLMNKLKLCRQDAYLICQNYFNFG